MKKGLIFICLVSLPTRIMVMYIVLCGKPFIAPPPPKKKHFCGVGDWDVCAPWLTMTSATLVLK